MIPRKHLGFNLSIIAIPWLSLLFIGKPSIRRYSLAGIFVIIFEIINRLYGHQKKWWEFYDKKDSFIKDELPFSIGPYMPLSMWLLKSSYGNFKKFILLNIIADGIFAFYFIDVLKRLKIVSLKRWSWLNNLNEVIYATFLYLQWNMKTLSI
jgi:hypothetical protein